MKNKVTRRSFLRTAGIGAVALGLNQVSCSTSRKASAQQVVAPPVQGFERAADTSEVYKGWKRITERKVRVGIAGYGVCKFGADFGFQNHPNVEIAAVTDLFPDRCAELARVCGCSKTYPSLEEMVKDDTIEAVFIATDAPGHARHAIEALSHGKHDMSEPTVKLKNLHRGPQRNSQRSTEIGFEGTI